MLMCRLLSIPCSGAVIIPRVAASDRRMNCTSISRQLVIIGPVASFRFGCLQIQTYIFFQTRRKEQLLALHQLIRHYWVINNGIMLQLRGGAEWSSCLLTGLKFWKMATYPPAIH